MNECDRLRENDDADVAGLWEARKVIESAIKELRGFGAERVARNARVGISGARIGRAGDGVELAADILMKPDAGTCSAVGAVACGEKYGRREKGS